LSCGPAQTFPRKKAALAQKNGQAPDIPREREKKKKIGQSGIVFCLPEAPAPRGFASLFAVWGARPTRKPAQLVGKKRFAHGIRGRLPKRRERRQRQKRQGSNAPAAEIDGGKKLLMMPGKKKNKKIPARPSPRPA